MIRPFTCCCLLLAAGTGLYTYQAKHQAELLDQQIAAVLRQVDAARQRTGMVRAEYARLNDPSRLSELAATHLPELRATEPGQFATLAELDRHLPPVGPPPPAVPPAAVAMPGEPGMGLPGVESPPPLPTGGAAASRMTAALSGPAVAPIEAAFSQASWPVVAKPVTDLKPDLAGRSGVPAQAPTETQAARPATRARPPTQKPVVAHLPHPDRFLTSVSASSDALARLTSAPAPSSGGVGRSGMGGSTVSSLGMARTGGGYPGSSAQ